MKSRDKYRFSLQWSADTDEKIQVGELLESLGNRKSEFIVVTVTEYIRLHPKIMATGQKVEIVVQPNYTRKQLEAIVQRIVSEKMSALTLQTTSGNSANDAKIITSELDIDAMLDNLDLFST